MGNTLPTTAIGFARRLKLSTLTAVLEREEAEALWARHAGEEGADRMTRDSLPDLFLALSQRLVDVLKSVNSPSFMAAQKRLGGARFAREEVAFRACLENKIVEGKSVSRFLKAAKYSEADGLQRGNFLETAEAGVRLTDYDELVWVNLMPMGPDGKRVPPLPPGPRPGSAASQASSDGAAPAPEDDDAKAADADAGAREADDMQRAHEAEAGARRQSVLQAIRTEDDTQRRQSMMAQHGSVPLQDKGDEAGDEPAAAEPQSPGPEEEEEKDE